PVGVLSGAATIARAELAALVRQPGIYLFVPVILFAIVSNAMKAMGPFETPLLLTSGQLATAIMGPLELFVCPLLLFYTVEALRRERTAGLWPIATAAPLRSASFVLGKVLAAIGMASLFVAAALAACVIALGLQGRVPIEPGTLAAVGY